MYLYLIVFFSSFILTYLVKEIARRKALIDVPDERSSHTIPTPRGGGIAIAMVWFVSISFLFYFNKIDKNLYYALLCGILVSVISFVDDLINLKALPRIIIQAIATVMALYFIGGLKRVDIGFCVFENTTILSIIAFLGILWFINLFNFIDGIDGYVATGSVFISLSVFFLFGDSLLLVFALSILGFLFWNWQRAKIFMGDVGSTLLGFTIGVLAVYYQNANISSLLIWIMLTSVFWFDATITLYRRFRNKEKLSIAHKKHAYQRIVQAGFSHQKTVMFSLIINFFLLMLVLISLKYLKLLIPLFILDLLCCFFVVLLVDKKLKN